MKLWYRGHDLIILFMCIKKKIEPTDVCNLYFKTANYLMLKQY